MDGANVRTLEDLREHFDLDKTIGYFLDGKLLEWLRERYYDEEGDTIENLSSDDVAFHHKLCQILGVKDIEENVEIDIEKIALRNKRLGMLKQYTSSQEVLAKVDQVAFDQEELAELLDDGVNEIYLCNNQFVIPLRLKGKKYIGVGKAEAVIYSKEKVDFNELKIAFENVAFDAKYTKVNQRTPKQSSESDRILSNRMTTIVEDAVA